MSAYDDIRAERDKQRKWEKRHRSPVEWSGLVSEEAGEVARQANNWTPHYIRPFDPDNLRYELVQVAVAAIRAIEDLETQGVIAADHKGPGAGS